MRAIVKMYACEIPKHSLEITVCDKKFVAVAQTYHAYEGIYIRDYEEQNGGKRPPLCFNADPEYTKKNSK